ncbi:unnamed protein product [Urochloa decumbens]|uniref:Uncharacterized protein n=1 Tax=Urochloa decumbens TaxID=240449 RepID=A0ABC9BSV3_9POAL
MRLDHNSPTTPGAMDASRATHVLFELPNYSQHRDLGTGSFLRSATFHAGGCAWSLRFYPCGQLSSKHVAAGLDLMTEDAVVTASYDMWLVDDGTTGALYSAVESDKAEFDMRCVEGFLRSWCVYKFMKRSELEASPYLRGDRLVLGCALRVVKATRVPGSQPVADELAAPPSVLAEDMGRLLDDDEGADVSFNVKGEIFGAHRVVLRVRTPEVFHAMLHRHHGMDDRGRSRIFIHDMEPAVFEAVLRFVYTDRLQLRQDMDELSKDGRVEMAHGLLAAAERFDMGRFKLVCERMLSKSLAVETVAATLALADRYNCGGLKEDCIDFMISSRMDDVARTKGYAVLKENHPLLLVEALEKAGKLGKV